MVVYTIGKIKHELYACICNGIDEDDIIVTSERIEHIRQRHPDDWERYAADLSTVLGDPDLLRMDGNPNTAIAVRKILVGDEEKYMRATVRLHTANDDADKKNSVLTYQKINKKEFG